MIFQVVIENGVKKIKALTADTGAGAPVGSFIYMYKKSNPSGYLYCDGSTFDQTKYPALYQYLGSNVLPDYRECVAVGAEQNTTDSIATHDVYTEGQFKDDQLQEHNHDLKQGDTLINKGSTTVGSDVSSLVFGNGSVYGYVGISNNSGRTGTTTHGKQKAVYIYIKATSGLTENQQENVLNTINENLSYSTTEHKTGKKWIDGKDIYERTFIYENKQIAVAQYNTIDSQFPISFAQVKKADSCIVATDMSIGLNWVIEGTEFKVYETMTGRTGTVIFNVEYTKTTDN